MNARRGNRVLFAALGGSLALHSIVALVARSTPIVVAKEPPPQPTRIVHLARRTATPQPSPKPHLIAAIPRRTVAASPRIATTHQINSGSPTYPDPPRGDSEPTSPVTTPGGTGDGTAMPAPTETPKPRCSTPNVAASTVDPIVPTAPEDAGGATGTAQIRVTISAAGAVESVEIYRPTGNFALDRAALAAARTSTYRPEIRDCVPVGGSYLFTAEFE